MGTDLTREDLVLKMDNIIDRVLINLKSWDGTMESGISIIETSEQDLDEFRTLSLQLMNPSITYKEKYFEKFNELLLEHKKLTSSLKTEQNQLVESMQQLSKKDRVINSYISIKQQPVFIDKDVT